MTENIKKITGKQVLEANPWEIQQQTAARAMETMGKLSSEGIKNQIGENGLQFVLDTVVDVSRQVLEAMTLSFDTESSGKRHTGIWNLPTTKIIGIQKTLLEEMGARGYDESQIDTVKRGLEGFQEEVMAINPQLILDLEKKQKIVNRE